MPSKRTAKVYTLYDGRYGYVTQSTPVYKLKSKRRWLVAALNVKQAIALLSQGKWYDGIALGVLAELESGFWSTWDKRLCSDPPYKHYQRFLG